MSIVENYSGDESDNEREKKEILQRMKCFNQLFVVASSSVQLYYEKYILKQPCMNSKQSGTGAKVSQCRERFQRSGLTISRYFAIVLEKVSRMATDLIAPEILSLAQYLNKYDCIGAIDGTHIAAILPPNEQISYIGRKGIPTLNVMAVILDHIEVSDIIYLTFVEVDRCLKIRMVEKDDDDDDDDDGEDDGESNNSSGFEMELTRDVIASSLMNSL
ncbi:hypothetical protein PVK06_020504 [Gossypium arboreum]|uniref:Nuclease HARBI1 n=1 Tax=Gossypium arboreum TaxID=29729 RepID=A0ABR0PMJ1_GOSAR|nr:hypothetical protein PVK06_020504 [Gossypium arboreum]